MNKQIEKILNNNYIVAPFSVLLQFISPIILFNYLITQYDIILFDKTFYNLIVYIIAIIVWNISLIVPIFCIIMIWVIFEKIYKSIK